MAGIDPVPDTIALAHQKAQRAAIEIDFRVGVTDDTFDVMIVSPIKHHLLGHLQVKGFAKLMRGQGLKMRNNFTPTFGPFDLLEQKSLPPDIGSKPNF